MSKTFYSVCYKLQYISFVSVPAASTFNRGIDPRTGKA